MEQIQTIKLDCKATLLVEENPAVRSAGFTWLLPLGNAYDPPNRLGISAALDDWLWRGAADLDTKQLSDAFDKLGIQRSSGIETHHLRLSATLIGDRIQDALPLLTSLILNPTLGDDTFEPVRDLCLQAIASLQDDPQTSCMLKLKEHQFPTPFNRSTYGSPDGLAALTPAEARTHYQSNTNPNNSIISVSGDVNPQQIADQLNTLFKSWAGTNHEPKESAPATRGNHHIQEDSAQCHIGLAFEAPNENNPDSMLQRIATAVLSGGLGSRLFTEVREKRSLCYSVYASYSAGRDRGALFAYAGTTPERAQETLDVMIAEFHKMRKGIAPDEFERAVIGMKSRLVMHGESTSARAATIAHDQYLLGHPRTLKQLAAEVDAITLNDVNSYLEDTPAKNFTTIVLGPQPLTPPAS